MLYYTCNQDNNAQLPLSDSKEAYEPFFVPCINVIHVSDSLGLHKAFITCTFDQCLVLLRYVYQFQFALIIYAWLQFIIQDFKEPFHCGLYGMYLFV